MAPSEDSKPYPNLVRPVCELLDVLNLREEGSSGRYIGGCHFVKMQILMYDL